MATTTGHTDRVTTEVPTVNQTVVDPCAVVKDFSIVAYLFALLSSVCIIALLSFLERRNDPNKCRWAGQRPGVIYPVNLLDDGDNRLGYAAAFGSMASSILNLFGMNSDIYTQFPIWSATLVTFVLVLVLGLLYYPLFACLSTTWVLLGSLFGMAFSTFWFAVHMKEVILCPNGSSEGGLPGQLIAQQIPVMACLFLLIVNFTIRFIKQIISIIRRGGISNIFTVPEDERKRLSVPHSLEYVKRLLMPKSRTSDINEADEDDVDHSVLRNFMIAVLKRLYKNDPTFQFSPRIIYIFTVAIICAYQFGMFLVLGGYQLNKVSRLLIPNDAAQNESSATALLNIVLPQARILFKVTTASVFLSFILSSLFILVTIFQILTSYRTDIRKLYKGDFKHFPFGRATYPARHILSNSLAYAGSQIAYTIWGYIIIFVALLVTCLLVAYIVILPLLGLVPHILVHFLTNLLVGVIITQVFFMVQKLYCRIFLLRRDVINKKGKNTRKPVLALDNRKLYHNVSYFLFFFYIILGIFGCLMTIIKGIFLGVVYLSRMDKCGLMSGFESWDKGYVYYVSFLHLEECHRHPVMLTFCDALIDVVQKHDLPLHAVDEETCVAHVTRSRRLIRNRWLKAYTLIRNPTLVNNGVGAGGEIIKAGGVGVGGKIIKAEIEC